MAGMSHTLSEIPATDALRLAEIGRLRLEVWRSETTVDEAQFPRDEWIEPLDARARHWIACRDGVLVAAARLTVHAELDDNPDGYLWRRANLEVPTPAAHLCKLVVHR